MVIQVDDGVSIQQVVFRCARPPCPVFDAIVGRFGSAVDTGVASAVDR